MPVQLMKRLRPWMLLIAVTLGAFIFLKYDVDLYQQPIARITQVTVTEASNTTDQFGNEVKQTHEELSATILNGKQKDTHIKMNQTYDTSLALAGPTSVNQQFFVKSGEEGSWQLQSEKRDYLWIPFLVFVFGLMLILFGEKSRRIIISTLMNVCLFITFIILDLTLSNPNVFQIFIGFSLLATVLTTGMILGFRSKNSWMVSMTVITSSAITMLISLIVFNCLNSNGLYFEHMELVTQEPASLFLAISLVGLLGAVLDIATDITVTMDALSKSRLDMSTSAIIDAGREVGLEIFGALNNVLLLIFIAEQIPIAVLYLRNGNAWDYTFTATLSLGFVQTLISAIGIVLTVPICLGYVLLFRRLKGGQA